MSQGITPYDFVRQVYYAQEKVLLDFWPTDDKYKEVLVEANLLLQELQNSEDWTWLRERIVLGDCHRHRNEIPEFQLPKWVYKPSTLYHDGLKLYRRRHHHHHHDVQDYAIGDFIDVPIASAGDNQYRKEMQFNGIGQIHVRDRRLRAIVMGDIVTFNRMLTPYEADRVAVLDVQRRIDQFHVCDHTCKGVDPDQPISYERDEDGDWENPCSRIEPIMLTEIPDPNYVIIATAARHAEGSPPAQARIQGLVDQAQKILSAMRQNDAAATDSDYADWDVPGYIEIV